MGLIKRLWDTFRLRKIPKSTLDAIIKDNYEIRDCNNCRHNPTFGYCKLIKDEVYGGFICDKHAYKAEFLLHEYNLRRVENLKEQLCYRVAKRSKR